MVDWEHVVTHRLKLIKQVSWPHGGHAAGCYSAMNPHLSDEVPASGHKSPINSEHWALLTSAELSPRPPIHQAPGYRWGFQRKGKVIAAGEARTNFRLSWDLAEEICSRWVQHSDMLPTHQNYRWDTVNDRLPVYTTDLSHVSVVNKVNYRFAGESWQPAGVCDEKSCRIKPGQNNQFVSTEVWDPGSSITAQKHT